MRLVTIGDAELEASDRGSGEPVVLVRTALTANEFGPPADQPVLRDGYQTILYHRRGYAGSRAVDGPGRVHSLTLLEPPPTQVPSAAEFRAANDRLLSIHHARGSAAALDAFLTLLIGRDWRADVERRLPGTTAQMQHDAATFFDTDLPALLAWRFGNDEARRIICPVLHIGGTDSGPWFAEVRELVLAWLPHAEDVQLAGADRSLVLTHSAEVADALVAFLRRHPIPDR